MSILRRNQKLATSSQTAPQDFDPKKGQSFEDVVLIQEAHKPDEYMPAFEDEHGTYIMNSKDLRAVEHVERLVKMGVHSLKIEGRTKSFYYCARTARVYHQAILDAMAGKSFNHSLNQELEHLAHRGYTEGFLQRHRHSDTQITTTATQRATLNNLLVK